MGGLRMPSVRALGYDRLDTALPSWLTVTRGAGSWSVQTAVAAAGTTFITTGTDQNTGRFSYVASAARRMLLIEPTRTNAILQSNFVDAGANNIPDGWSEAVGGGAGVRYFVDAATGPHGGAALRFADSSNRGCNYPGGGVFGGATTFACSVWVRRTAAAGAVTLYTIQTDAGTFPTMALGAATHDWTRYQSNQTTVGAQTNSFMLDIAAGAAGDTGSLSLPQVEAGAYATSWIPTTAATVARAAELCTVSTSVVGATSGFVSFLFSPEYANNTFATIHTLFEWAPGWRLDYDGADDKFKVVVNTTNRAESAAQTFSAGQLYRLSVRYGAGGTVLTVDKAGSGAAQTSDTTAWGSPTLACYLGSRAASANCEGAAYSDWLSAA